MTVWDAPNQQAVREDESAPWDEGTGGSPDAKAEGDLMSLTKAELLERAETMGADVDESMTKAELVEAMGG